MFVGGHYQVRKLVPFREDCRELAEEAAAGPALVFCDWLLSDKDTVGIKSPNTSCFIIYDMMKPEGP